MVFRVIDSVFSIAARYSSTKNVVKRFADYLNKSITDEYLVTEFITQFDISNGHEILMKSIEIKVPRNLIRQFYPHPEPYGDGYYVVHLLNGMHTDLFKRPDGQFVTSKNDENLIKYLTKKRF